MRKPYGLTGNIGCGKSTIAGILESKGVVVYYSDAIAKEIIADPVHRKKVVEILGTEAPFLENPINWRMIAKIIFADKQIRYSIEQFSHPLVWGRIVWKMDFLPADTIVVVESAIIYEVRWADRFEAIIVATCSKEEQVRRLRTSRNMSDGDISARMHQQIPSDEKEVFGDYVISTECSLEQLNERVSDLYLNLKQLNNKENMQ